MPTIISLLKELPRPYSEQAINNTFPGNLDIDVPDLKTALDRAFNWRNSVEGFKYWDDIYDLYAAKETEDSQPINPVPAALKILVDALKQDPMYEQGWRSNIAMCIKDEFDDLTYAPPGDLHKKANAAADRFLNLLYEQQSPGK